MTDTVPVTVNLPKPLEGLEIFEQGRSISTDGSVVVRFSSRRVAPPECMAVEMLVSDVLVWAAGRTSPAIDGRAFDAARKALREAEECGYRFDGCTDTVSCPHYCRQPKGHPEGKHSPEAQSERMVAVMLTESDRQHWASYYVPPASRGPQGTPAARLFDAARKA